MRSFRIRLTKSGDGKAKIFKNSTVESFYDYFETFKERNIFKDGKLAQLVERAQAVLENRPAETIRSKESMMEFIIEGTTVIEEVMADLIEKMAISC